MGDGLDIFFDDTRDFDEFKIRLKSIFSNYTPRAVDKPEFRKSAVMMLLLNRDNQACVLLTKRTSTVSSHKGQMSFPGGGYDDEDLDLMQTALRETREEVGIAPEDIEPAGRFDDFISIAGFHVACYIGFIPHPYEYSINRDEIDDYVEVPLSLFRDERYDRVETVEFEGNSYSVYYYSYNGFIIWGMTARILTDFARKVLKYGEREG
ncbi:MAG TPA: CoA pyrophosphatase [Spirochaetes bacterium]|nr:CoA pyrophosphatase [Spirochaetota bacterium]